MRTLAPLFGVLMLIALIIKLIWWILGAVALYVLFRVARWQLRLARFRREAEGGVALRSLREIGRAHV